MREAIKKVPKNKDYIILDRCAGSGQLEKFLTHEELSHCVLSTIGIAEWISLWNTYGNKVRCIIPPFINGKQINNTTTPNDLKKQVDFAKNEVKGADALSEEFYKKNSKLWKNKFLIVLENPPYADATTNMHNKAIKDRSNQTYIKTKMKGKGIGAAINDLYTQFIWSAINIVNCDELIVYGPIKQWKMNNLLNKHFNAGHLCNREKFHATESAIALQWYSNRDENKDALKYTSDIKECIVKRIKSKWNLYVEHNPKLPILAKMIAQGGNRNMQGATIMSPSSKATSHVKYIDIDIENILVNLPLFVSNFWKDKNYITKEVIMKSADGGITYRNDVEFLNNCANWTYFTNKNKCSPSDPIWEVLEMKIKFHNDLLLTANNIKKFAKIEKWEGLDYIDKFYNKKIENKYGQKVPENPQLNEAIKELKTKLNVFYDDHIAKKMFHYQLLK